MIIPLSVKNQSIDSSGITNDYRDAISEYIWNGFEAHARNINIDYTLNEAYGVKELIITDNGDGINYDELGETFGAFLASKKNLLSLKMKSKANKSSCLMNHSRSAASWQHIRQAPPEKEPYS